MSLDLGHFRKINDSFMHNTGDRILGMIGELINNMIRRGDIAVRYGGKEILLMLPCAEADEKPYQAKHSGRNRFVF